MIQTNTPQEEPSDQELLQRLVAGDQAAVQTLVERYQARLVDYAARFLTSPDLAKDIAQEVFLKLLDAPPSHLQNGLLGPWLFRVARNLAIDVMRHGKFEIASGSPTDLPSIDANAPASVAGDPLHALMASSDAEQLRRLCNQLPEDLRAVVEDRVDGNLSFQEIAEKEHIPLGTALWRVHHAFEILRRRWLEEA